MSASHSKGVKEVVGCLDHIQSETLNLGINIGPGKKEVYGNPLMF